MIDYRDKDNNDLSYLFYEDSIHKNCIITFYHIDNGEIIIDDRYDNADLLQESVKISESICSQQTLMFGGCESNQFGCTLQGIRTSHLNQIFTVDLILNYDTENPFRVGTYKVQSDKPTADREGRELIAYDVLYDILNSDIVTWYNTLPTSFTVKQMRDSFFSYYEIEQIETELPNDSIPLSKVAKESLSGKKFLTNLCEVNGCFGRISRDNKFQYVFLKEAIEGLYPSETLYPSDDLYPREEAVGKVIYKSQYIKATYADYRVNRITKVQMWDSKYEKVVTSGSGDNIYNVADNIFVDMIPVAQRQTVCGNMYGKMSSVWYMICDVSAFGNPCLEVGDSIRLVTKYDVVYLYIMERRLNGIQALKDDYVSNGEEFRLDDMSSRSPYSAYMKETTSAIGQNTSSIQSVNTSLSNLSNVAWTDNNASTKINNNGIFTTNNIYSGAVNTALNGAVAGLGYLTKSSADNYYLTESSANNKYQPKGSYLTKDTADGYYQPKGSYYSSVSDVNNAFKYSAMTPQRLITTGAAEIGGNLAVSGAMTLGGHRLTFNRIGTYYVLSYSAGQ